MKTANNYISPDNQLTDEQKLFLLRSILLKEERAKIEQVDQTINNPTELSDKIGPIIEQHLDELKQNFPIEFQRSVERIVERKIESSQDAILDIIYPKLGKMIQKYIQHQFQSLKESIDLQIETTLNNGAIGWLRRTVFGIKISDEILSAVDRPIIEEIYIVKRNSGILLGSASLNNKIHQDVIAGMLTAIKAFAEDAFQQENADLELIQYDVYRILLQNIHTYYIAAVINGSFSASQQDKLSNELSTFAAKEINPLLKNSNQHTNFLIKEKLQQYFIKTQK